MWFKTSYVSLHAAMLKCLINWGKNYGRKQTKCTLGFVVVQIKLKELYIYTLYILGHY
jgi:hypothetical protein